MATPSFLSCVCWEWQRDDRSFSPYSPQDSGIIERAYGKGESSVALSKYRVFLSGRSFQKSYSTENERKVRRTPLQLSSTQSTVAYWTWEEKPSKFVPYETQASIFIEEVYQSRCMSIDLSTTWIGIPYIIDFHNMEQTRHHYNTRRRIKRCSLPSGTTVQSLLAVSTPPPLVHTLATPTPASYGSVYDTSKATSRLYFPNTSPVLNSTRGNIFHTSHISTAAGFTNGIPSTSTIHAASLASNYSPPVMSMRSRAKAPPTQSPLNNTHVHHSSPARTRASTTSSPSTTNYNGDDDVIYVGTTTRRTTTKSSRTSKRVGATADTHSPAHPVPLKSKGPGTIKSGGDTKGPSISKSLSPMKTRSIQISSEVPSHKKVCSVGRTNKGKGRSKSVRGLEDRFSGYVRVVSWVKHDKDEPCPICMNNLTEAPGFDDDTPDPPTTTSALVPKLDVCKLRKCGHMLHRPCLLMYIKSTSTQSGFQCPTCKKSYGVRTGDMPPGSMTTNIKHFSLPGHEGYNTIEIVYDFKPGVHNGRRYRAHAFPRICYLPNSPKGQKVLKLLCVAWDRRLTFTIGTSVTTGMTDVIVWNEIHHKTSTNNYGGHGYPDPNYLDNVLLELAAQGVEEGGCESEEVCESEDEEFVIESDNDDDL